MNYTLNFLPKSEVEISVSIPFAEFEPQIKRAAALISESIDIEGFRRGKATFDVVKKRLGEAAILERASELAARTSYTKVLDEIFLEMKEKGKEFLPIGRPEVVITKLAWGNELEYKIKLALLPPVKLPDYKRIAAKTVKEKKEVKVDDEEVVKALDWIRESRAPLVAVNRPAQKGDSAEIDFEVRSRGAAIELGESKNHPLVLGQGRFVPGFEDELIGMSAGEEKTFSLKAPEEWRDKSVAGRKLDFAVKMKSVQERKIPELDDEFARKLGNFETRDALEKNIREGIEAEKKEKEIQRVRSLVAERISQNAEVDPPQALIATELKKMIQEFRSGVEGMGMKWEDYLSHLKKKEDDFKKEWDGDARKRVRQALILRAIANEEKIEAPEEEIKARADQFLAQFGNAEDAQKNIDPEELIEYTKGVLRNEKVFEFLEKQ